MKVRQIDGQVRGLPATPALARCAEPERLTMRDADLGHLPLRDLLTLRVSVDAEISARGYSRTSSSLAGELMERIVATTYGGTLTAVGTKSVDVVASDGRRLQVKVRFLPPGVLRHWAFRDVVFDAAVVVSMDQDTFDINWARELSHTEVVTLARPHSSDGWRVRMAAAQHVGVDVTEQLQLTYSQLR